MKYLKLLPKILIGFVGLFVIVIIVLHSAEGYQTITKENGNKTVMVEIKKVFGRKISECSINSSGFYNGLSKTWDLFNNTLRSEGSFRDGFWDGAWRDYNRDGQLTMVREWNMGKLSKVFIPAGGTLKELPKEEWPKYVDVKQSKPQRVHR
jgi:antitoxin component YwqK of YwqJK toxin-antitoxin module